MWQAKIRVEATYSEVCVNLSACVLTIEINAEKNNLLGYIKCKGAFMNVPATAWMAQSFKPGTLGFGSRCDIKHAEIKPVFCLRAQQGLCLKILVFCPSPHLPACSL